MPLSRKLLIGVGLLGLAALALRLAFFGVSVAHVPASSDEVLSTLQAKMIVAEGRRPLLVMANPYQFPVESYLQAPFVKILPRTALGARSLPFALSLAATLVFILTLGRLAPLRTAWPALLLLLFPSAYVLMLSSAYFIPQHSSFALLCSLALYLALRMRATHPLGWALASGFCAGLAFSNHLLALPFLAALGAYALLGPDRQNQKRILPAFAVGTAVGLVPCFLAVWLLPGAYGDITGSVSLGEALRRVWGLTLNSALSGVMGISPCLFPDNRARLWQIPGLNTGFAVAWIVVLAAMTGLRAWRFAHRMKETGRMTLEANDVFLGLAWLGFASFLFSARALSHTYRYLLPVAWAFPFMVGYLYARAPRPARVALGAGAVLLAGFNIVASLALMRAWTAPGFAVRAANLIELKPAIDYLEARGIRHAYASYWLAYRLTYETDGHVLGSQPYNERFPGWFAPYKAIVDAADDVAYLTTPKLAFDARRFEADLAAMGVDCQRENFGAIRVYTDFQRKPTGRGKPIARARIRAAASHQPTRPEALLDGSLATSWQTLDSQRAGMWIQLDLHEPATLNAVAISYAPGYQGYARTIAIMSRAEADWRDVADRTIAHQLDRFDFLNAHPVYGRQTQTIALPAINTTSLRLVIRDPTPDKAWAIAEIELYGTSR